jgi:diguanylate cyclase (GGDEF)-like protein
VSVPVGPPPTVSTPTKPSAGGHVPTTPTRSTTSPNTTIPVVTRGRGFTPPPSTQPTKSGVSGAGEITEAPGPLLLPLPQTRLTLTFPGTSAGVAGRSAVRRLVGQTPVVPPLGARRINHPELPIGRAGAISRFIRFIPTWVWILIGALAALAVAAVTTSAWSARMARHNATLVAEVSAAALTDPLTGVLNRRGFVSAFERELDRARRYGRPLALAFLDVRGLKSVNDQYGHLAGDRLLREVAHLLEESARAHDVVGRIGGDELAVLLPEQSAAGVARVVQRVRAQIPSRRSDLGLGTDWDLTVGVALFPEDGDAVEELLGTADRRLYEQRGIELR